VNTCDEFRRFDRPDYVKVAWSIRVLPWGESDSRVEFELRVDATDDAAWRKFQRYFSVIGPASAFIRRSLLSALASELGTPEGAEDSRPLAGDELLPDASAEITQGITIAAAPDRIWPWLLQMGCRRAGFYSIDLLDNGGERSAREVDSELAELEVGQIVAATPDGEDGFEVLRIEPERILVLGGLYDADRNGQLPFTAERPQRFWHVSWSFVLEPLAPDTTRLHVRARAAFAATERLHAAWIRPVHRLMQGAMLRHLAQRAENRLPRDDYHDVVEGLLGGGLIFMHLLAPFQRAPRSHWGVDESVAERRHPGDELVRAPRWSWTHGIEIDAPAADVWPWVAQLGADRAGFYSYQWLENLAGCGLRNAEVVHPEWQVRLGDELLLHPKAPRVPVVMLEPGRYFVLHAAPDQAARAVGKAWACMSWMFLVEPRGKTSCRLISRYRADCSSDLRTLLGYGPLLLEPVAFAMDRRMLQGIKQRAERKIHRRKPSLSQSR
jgi:hypothetical protein